MIGIIVSAILLVGLALYAIALPYLASVAPTITYA
jgi:hypothetical protein